MTEIEKLEGMISRFIGHHNEKPVEIHMLSKKAAELMDECNEYLRRDGEAKLTKVDPENVPPFMFMGIKCIPKDGVLYRSVLTGELEQSSTGFALFKKGEEI